MRVLALMLAVLATVPAISRAQSVPSASAIKGYEIAFSYERVRTNAQPSECGCFGLNGGGVSGAVALTPHFSAVAKMDSETLTNVQGTGNSLTLTSAHAGIRAYLTGHRVPSRLRPFAELLPGAVHVGGSASGSAAGTIQFSGRAGGGADLFFSRHIGWRIAEIDYDLTIFSNGSTDRQNNLVTGSGLIYRW